MADYFSDHYSATVGATSVDDPRIKAAPGIAHAKIHYKRAVVTVPTTVLAADVARFMTLKTSDRILDIQLTKVVTTTATTWTADMGCYNSTLNHAGPVIDVDMFASAFNILQVLNRSDQFAEASLEVEDRGKMLYQLADDTLGSAVYDNDPHEAWDLALTMVTVTGVPAIPAEIIMEVRYTSAGS